MAIDLTQIQRQVLDRAQSGLTGEAQWTEEARPGEGAARFEQLIESPEGPAGAPESAAVANPGIDRAQPAGSVADAGSPPVVGDRILANVHPGALPATGVTGADAAAPVGAKPGIDIGDPMDRLAVQIRVAELKTEVSLATATVQKASQGVDTLLKSQ